MKKIVTFLCIFATLTSFGQNTDKPFRVLKKHKGGVVSLAFSPDGKLLATGSEDKTVIIWNLNTYEPEQILEGHVSKVQAIAFAPLGNIVYTGGDNLIRVWDNWKQKSALGGPSTYFWTLSISPTGSMITGGTLENSPKVWNLIKPEKTLRKLEKHKKSTLVSKFSPDGKYIVTGSLDMTINIWSADSFKVLKTFNGHAGNIFDIVWAADSKHFVSTSADKNLILWNADSAKWIRKFVGHGNSVTSVVLTPDNYFAISAGADKSVRLWELSTGNNFYTLDFKDTPNAVALSKDGNALAIALSNNNIELYRFDNQWIVDAKYAEAVQKELEESKLFRPRGKNESKESFEKREKEAEEFKTNLYKKYFELYKRENKGL